MYCVVVRVVTIIVDIIVSSIIKGAEVLRVEKFYV